MRALRFLIMAWMLLVGAIRSGLLGPNRLAIREAYGLSETDFGAAVAIVQVAASMLVLLAARRYRDARPVRVMMLALGAAAAGFAAIALVPGVWAFVGGWALVMSGFVLGAVSNNISMDVWRDDPRRGVAVIHTFNSGGKIAGTLVSAVWVATRWRLSFASMGLACLAVLGLFLLMRRTGDRPAARGAPAPAPARTPDRRVLRRPLYWLVLACFGLVSGGEVVVATLVPEYFVLVRGTTETTGTLMLLVHLAGLLAGRLLMIGRGRRLGSGALIGLSLAAGVFAVPLLAVAHSAVGAVSLFGLGFMFSTSWPTFYARAARHMARDRDMLAYGSYLGSNLGVALCILVSSRLADASLTWAVAFGPAVMALFGLVYALSPLARLPRDAPDAGPA